MYKHIYNYDKNFLFNIFYNTLQEIYTHKSLLKYENIYKKLNKNFATFLTCKN